MSNRSLFQNYNTAATHALEADADGSGTYSKLLIERLMINGGTEGDLTMTESDDSTSDGLDTRIGIITIPASFTPFSIECGFIVEDIFLITASAATDFTVVFKRLP